MANKHFYLLLIFFILIKLGYLIMHFSFPFPEFNRISPDLENGTWYVFSNNDSGWYEKIASNGYPEISSKEEKEAAVYAFFPLYPMTTRAIVKVTSFSPLKVMVIVSQIFSLFMVFMLYQFIKAYTKSNEKALYASMIWIAFPHHFYFSMAYTESLFLALAITSFYGILSRKTAIFIIASSLLVLTRINGIFLLIPLLVFEFQINRTFNWIQMRKFLPMVLTLVGYLFFIKYQTGEFFAFKDISEIHWYGNPQNPFQTLYNHLSFIRKKWYLNYNGVYAVIFILLSFIFLKRKEYAFFLFALIGIFLPLYEGSTLSQPRFISVIFPFALIFVSFFKNYKLKNILVVVLLGLHYWTYWFWMTNHPLSY